MWHANGVPKKSTFFPSCWDEYILIDKSLEALKNLSDVELACDGLNIWGKTLEQIEIAFFLHNKGSIDTFYPLLKEGIF